MEHMPLSCRNRSFGGGRVTLEPGEEAGEHVTDGREELIVVLKGRATLIKGNERIELSEGEIHFIEEGTRHNVKNLSKEPLEYVYLVRALEKHHSL